MEPKNLILMCLVLLLRANYSRSCIFYVIPSSDLEQTHLCPDSGEPCHTLEQYARNGSLLLCTIEAEQQDRNISLLFLDGTHNLCHTLSISNNDLSSINLQRLPAQLPQNSADLTLGVTINVTCVTDNNGILLSAPNVSVQHLTIVSNGTVGLSISQSTTILVNNVTFRSSTLSLRGTIHSSVTVKHCKFVIDKRSFPISPIKTVLVKDIYISNVVVTSKHLEPPWVPYPPPSKEPRPDVLIYLPYPEASISVVIVDSVFNRSSELGIFVSSLFPGHDIPSTGYSVYIYLKNTIISKHWNGAVVLDASFKTPDSANIKVEFYNTTIHYNEVNFCNGAVNGAVNGAGFTLYSRENPDFSFNSSQMTFSQVKVLYNWNKCTDDVIISTNKLVSKVTVINSTFDQNQGTSLSLTNADLYFQSLHFGEVTRFSKNAANRGPALVLNSANVFLVGCVNVEFVSNFVMDVGGAIFIESSHIEFDSIFTNRKCFYQYIDVDSHGFPCFQLSFLGNSAENGGDNIYGALMKSNCIVYAPDGPSPSGKALTVRGYELVYGTQLCIDNKPCFVFQPNLTESVSPISSSPLRVCLCDENLNGTIPNIRCTAISDIFPSVEVFPGELFHVSAALVGADFGTTTGSIYAQLLYGPALNPTLKTFQYSQRVSGTHVCSQLSYTVSSSMILKYITLVLTATDTTVHDIIGNGTEVELINDSQNRDSFKLLSTTPVYINVILRDCPLGFVLSDLTMGCECDPELEKHGIMCSISNSTGFIRRTGKYWINATVNGDSESDIIVHKYCPYSYCKTGELDLDLRYPDTQCDWHHAGILCGGCEQNYSLSLGSDKCVLCQDASHVGLLLLFLALGILLVFFIQFLDLTVKQGIINGLIFYANVVWAYRYIFLPDSTTPYGLQIFLQTFIAWLNLDFGIETCFFKGLDAYWKTWLQFTFPLYIWSIAALMIKLSACSEKIAKVFGKNSVHVLATLILLSYNKLLRACITALNFTFITHSATNAKKAVWSFDGNLKYCGFPHVLLFIAAIVVLLLLWVPYTLVLTLVQWLRNEKISRFRIMKWIDNIKLKPFFDAYLAPLKDKHRYWVRLLLFVRGILMVTFALTYADSPTANLLTIGLFTGLLLLHQGYNGRVYKSRWLSFLENSFICNLVVLSVATLYLYGVDNDYYPVVFHCSIGVAFCQFIGVVLYRGYKQITTIFCSPRAQDYVNLDDSLLLDNGGRDR